MSIEKDVRNFLNGISENSKIYFDGETDKSPLDYSSGELMTFKLKVKTDEKDIPVPFISAKCSGDDGKTTEEIIPKSSDGYFYVKTSCERDGFVRVIAKALDENKEIIDGIDVFEGGAGVDIDKIKLCTKEPLDYFDYWADLKRQAEAIPRKVLYENDINAKEGFITKDMRFETTAGKFLSLIVTYPKSAMPGSLKLRMSFMGYGVNTANAGYANDSMVISVNSHDIQNFLNPDEYAHLRATDYASYGFIAEENKDPKTSYWNKMMLRDLQAIALFKNHELLTGKDYIFIGGSQGAMQACHMALHSGIATECYLNVPWCCDLWAIDKEKRMRGWRPDTSKAMEYFDTAVAASHLTCPVYIEAGLGDYVCPPSGEMAMYNAIKAPKKIVFVQNQTHPYRPPVRKKYSICDGYPESNFSF